MTRGQPSEGQPFTSATGRIALRSRTFEELLGSELDRLYGAALFLTCGHGGEAERILTAAVVEAFRAHQQRARDRAEPERTDLLLEIHLTRVFLRAERDRWQSSLPESLEARPSAASQPDQLLAEPAFEALAHAAAVLSPLQRAVFWLATFERRDYNTIGRTVGVDRVEVTRLIREAHPRMKQRLEQMAGASPDDQRRHQGEM